MLNIGRALGKSRILQILLVLSLLIEVCLQGKSLTTPKGLLNVFHWSNYFLRHFSAQLLQA